MNEVRNLLIGIELTEKHAQLCYFDRKLKDPVSVPMRVGTNLYHFPMELVKLPGKEEWRIGYEAEYFLKSEGGIALPNPFLLAEVGKEAEAEGRKYAAEEVLAAFLREALRFLGVPGVVAATEGIGVVCEYLNRTLASVIRKALLLLGFRAGQCFIADFGESFYYYCYSQKVEVCARGLGLIRFYGNMAAFSDLSERRDTKPHTVELKEMGRGELPEEPEARDEAFSLLVNEWTADKAYSGLFLTGEGFGMDWAKVSLKTLSKAASHVFEGDNLFAKGSCWMVYELLEKKSFTGRLYLGPALVRSSVGIDITVQSKQQFFPLIEAGRSCYASDAEYDLILDGQTELLLKVRKHGEKDTETVRLPLDGLPERPERATRLRLTLSCPDENSCHVRAEDLGFGELFPATHLVWETEVAL